MKGRMGWFFLVFLVAGYGSAARLEPEMRKHRFASETRGFDFLYTRSRGRCTPQYWSSRREAWPKMVPQTSSVSKIFGSQAIERYASDLTLLEATDRNDESSNAFSHLLKESTAALLNSYSRKPFPYSAWQVKTLLIQALVSAEAAAAQAGLFASANQACQ